MLGVMDILHPVVLPMRKPQSVNLPAWKIAVYLPKVEHHLEFLHSNLADMKNGEGSLSEELFPR